MQEAKRVTLEPTQTVKVAGSERYLIKILKGRSITKGQIIRVEMLGNPITFVVTNTLPSGTVVPSVDTEIVLRKVREGATGVPHIAYEDICGLQREISMIKDMIELSLRHPKLFERLGIEPPKGVLLHGPPGTGKTMIAKALSNEADNFIMLDPAEMYLFVGDGSQRNLNDIFKEAEEIAPTVIFIDQIDLITNRLVLAHLISLMDNLSSIEKKVIIIGATNRIDMLDEALRRRFLVKIKICIPDKNIREEILQVHTRGMPLAYDVNLNEFADLTQGFVGADLAILCKEAAMHALRSILPEIDIEKEIPPEVMGKLKVRKEDFSEALKSFEMIGRKSPTKKDPAVQEMEE